MPKTGGGRHDAGRGPFHSGVAYAHFFTRPGEVSLFCPDGHLPVEFVCGLPLPGPTVIAAVAGAAVMASADADNTTASILRRMCTSLRWLPSSHVRCVVDPVLPDQDRPPQGPRPLGRPIAQALARSRLGLDPAVV